MVNEQTPYRQHPRTGLNLGLWSCVALAVPTVPFYLPKCGMKSTIFDLSSDLSTYGNEILEHIAQLNKTKNNLNILADF